MFWDPSLFMKVKVKVFFMFFYIQPWMLTLLYSSLNILEYKNLSNIQKNFFNNSFFSLFLPTGSKQRHMEEYCAKFWKKTPQYMDRKRTKSVFFYCYIDLSEERQVCCILRQFLSRMIPTQPTIHYGINYKVIFEISTSGKHRMDKKLPESKAMMI